MNANAKPVPQTEPETPEPGYEEWLGAEIEAARAEAKAKRVVPAEEAWRELGLE